MYAYRPVEQTEHYLRILARPQYLTEVTEKCPFWDQQFRFGAQARPSSPRGERATAGQSNWHSDSKSTPWHSSGRTESAALWTCAPWQAVPETPGSACSWTESHSASQRLCTSRPPAHSPHSSRSSACSSAWSRSAPSSPADSGCRPALADPHRDRWRESAPGYSRKRSLSHAANCGAAASSCASSHRFSSPKLWALPGPASHCSKTGSGCRDG